MNRPHSTWLAICLALGGSAVAASCADQGDSLGDVGSSSEALHQLLPAGYNIFLNLYDVRHQNFEPIQPGSDADHGRALFGVAADLRTEDPSEGIFEGFSVAAGREIVSNGRTCFTCHRGADVSFGMPRAPLSASIPASDPLFTGIEADAQGDPDAAYNLENLALLKYRPNRFHPARSEDDPFRQVFFWRKSPALVNIAFAHGHLNDGRGRALLETDRGAMLGHTQSGDDRFDDLLPFQNFLDLTAFQFSLVSDPRLLALRDPEDPLHDRLVNDPFYTVEVHTRAERRGKAVFQRYCMSCHNAPNVFNNAAALEVLGTDGHDPGNPVPGPHIGHNYNIGVAERNLHDLRFTRYVGPGQYEPIVLPLANEDGSINMHTVTFDVGLAASTARSVDVGRFKVPQLRNLRNIGPYFHDNSAQTLEEVVDYFNSDAYNHSADGWRRPIHLTPRERADLLAFLNVL
jgi:cytochrome c peroxidase